MPEKLDEVDSDYGDPDYPWEAYNAPENEGAGVCLTKMAAKTPSGIIDPPKSVAISLQPSEMPSPLHFSIHYGMAKSP